MNSLGLSVQTLLPKSKTLLLRRQPSITFRVQNLLVRYHSGTFRLKYKLSAAPSTPGPAPRAVMEWDGILEIRTAIWKREEWGIQIPHWSMAVVSSCQAALGGLPASAVVGVPTSVRLAALVCAFLGEPPPPYPRPFLWQFFSVCFPLPGTKVSPACFLREPEGVDVFSPTWSPSFTRL